MANDTQAGRQQRPLAALVGPDPRAEGWTRVRNSRTWHYYRDCRAICGGMMMLCHPRYGYDLGNDDSADNCADCKRKLAAEKCRMSRQMPL